MEEECTSSQESRGSKRRSPGDSRRRHSHDFKIKAVKQQVEQDCCIRKVAPGLDINASLVMRGQFEYEADSTVAFAFTIFVVATVAAVTACLR